MNEDGYCYKVQTQAVKVGEETKPIERVTYDPEVLKQMMQDSIIVQKDSDISEPVEEIDLHIEELTKDFSSMSNAEMLHLQMSRFQQALERAIAHGANRLYVIHGVGSGKLRNEIHRMLKQYPPVKSFSNEHHARYGYGATEVILH